MLLSLVFCSNFTCCKKVQSSCMCPSTIQFEMPTRQNRQKCALAISTGKYILAILPTPMPSKHSKHSLEDCLLCKLKSTENKVSQSDYELGTGKDDGLWCCQSTPTVLECTKWIDSQLNSIFGSHPKATHHQEMLVTHSIS